MLVQQGNRNSVAIDSNGKHSARAMSSSIDQLKASPAASDVGGIDVNPALLDLRIKGNDKGMLAQMKQGLSQISINGLVPIIETITPITDLQLTWGAIQI
jgi:hypothetical protein